MSQLLKKSLFLGIVILQSVYAQTLTCSDNEVHTNCINTCDGTCEQTFVDCTEECEMGEACACKSDYVRNEKGVCIPLSECPITCPKHEHLINCAINLCEPTCENLNPICNKLCLRGSSCTCDPGYVRHNGVCIPKNKCPKCKENEAYTYCGSSCPGSCRNPYSVGLACTLQCVPGCFCKSDYTKNSAGKCVKIEDCGDKDCGRNEYFSVCGSPCDSGSLEDDPDCSGPCYPGCFCGVGFVRDPATKVCVKN